MEGEEELGALKCGDDANTSDELVYGVNFDKGKDEDTDSDCEAKLLKQNSGYICDVFIGPQNKIGLDDNGSQTEGYSDDNKPTVPNNDQNCDNVPAGTQDNVSEAKVDELNGLSVNDEKDITGDEKESAITGQERKLKMM